MNRLAKDNNLYLVGHETLGQRNGAAPSGADDWSYYLPDALGSVRQVADEVGNVAYAREWTPYGVEVGASQTGLGYTGEWEDSALGMTYLRARWYDAQAGRFTQEDSWPGDIWRPRTLLQKFAYTGNNPITFRDPSGYVDCSAWPSPSRWMCEQANAGDLDAIELVYHAIALFASYRGGIGYEVDDYDLANVMLFHYLEGNGAHLDLSAWGKRFGKDPNIAEAANILFYAFLLNDVRPASQLSPVSLEDFLYQGLDYYT